MKFIKNCQGNTAITVALLFPVVIGAAGAAVDTSYAVMLKGELSQITKMACSRLATSAARTASASEQNALTGETITAHLGESRLNPNLTEFSYAPAAGSRATVTGRSIYEAKFMPIFGFSQIGISAEESCPFNMRIPTGTPPTQCDATVYARSAGTSESISLSQAQQLWRQRNETCIWVQEVDGGYTDANGNWIPTYRNVQDCTLPPPPDEVIVTVVSSAGDAVYARELLSTQPDRGDTLMQESGLPSGGLLTVQPLNGYPLVLPEACSGTPPPIFTPAPPPLPLPAPLPLPPQPTTPPVFTPTTTSPTSAGGTGSSSSSGGAAPPSGECDSSSFVGSSTTTSSTTGGGSTTTSTSASSGGGCGGETRVNSRANVDSDGNYTADVTATNGNETSTSSDAGTSGGVSVGGYANPTGVGTVAGPAGSVDFGGVDAWLP